MPPRTHDVDVLVELCATLDPDFVRLQQVVEGLTEFAVIFRYPQEWSDESSAADSQDKVQRVRDLVREKLGLTD